MGREMFLVRIGIQIKMEIDTRCSGVDKDKIDACNIDELSPTT